MRLLTIPEFLNCKSHDSLCIFGSGYSINWITGSQWEVIDSEFDTWGMGWYCKMKKPTTWYMVREQCATKNRLQEGHRLEDFYEDMGYLIKSIKVVKDMSYRTNNYQHIRNLDNLEGEGYVFTEIYGGCSAKSFRADIFNEGIHHGKCSMYDALHFAVRMNYQKILFCGVDLYDSRCFYMGYNETLPLVLQEGRTCDTPHKTAENTVDIVKKTAMTWPVEMWVHNPKSLLANIIPVWRVQ